MFKIDLPPDSSWDWEVRTYGEPLPAGRYVLVEDYDKVKTITNKLIETSKKLTKEYNDHLEQLTKERDQAVEFLSMKLENLNENGKTILDFQAVWIRQARVEIEKLQAKNSELEKKLSECEKLKNGYYNEAVEGWSKFREYDRKIKGLVEYQKLYIQYLTGGMTKEEFKKLAINFAEPLVIDRNSKEPK